MSETVPLYCPSCQAEESLPMPLEPFWSVKQAVFLIPMTNANALYQALYSYKKALPEPIYRQLSNGVRVRMLRTSELHQLRELLRVPYRRKTKG